MSHRDTRASPGDRTPPKYETLEPEFDLVEEIYATHQRYNIAASFQHVKGHQDGSKELRSLPLPAQLNVEADSLAGPLSTQTVIMETLV